MAVASLQKDLPHSSPSFVAYSRDYLMHNVRKKNAFAGEYVDLSGLDLRGINFTNCAFANVILEYAQMDRKSLVTLLPLIKKNKIALTGIDLSNADLSGSVLKRPRLGVAGIARISLEGLNLSKARFTQANLCHIDLDNTILHQANFDDANMQYAFLRNACLVDADMIRVNLMYAELAKADLRGANLTAAKIAYAHIEGIKL